MNKEEDLKKEIEKIKSIAFKNGWKIGKHLFNYLNEIQMFQYDNIKYEIDRLEAEQIFSKMIEKSPIKERIDKEFRKHKTLDWSKIAEIKIKSEIKSNINSSQEVQPQGDKSVSLNEACEGAIIKQPANKEPEEMIESSAPSSSGSDNQICAKCGEDREENYLSNGDCIAPKIFGLPQTKFVPKEKKDE